jgi:hypothetical protein
MDRGRGYGKVIENYTLLRYPRRKVRFIPIPDQLNRYMLTVRNLPPVFLTLTGVPYHSQRWLTTVARGG